MATLFFQRRQFITSFSLFFMVFTFSSIEKIEPAPIVQPQALKGFSNEEQGEIGRFFPSISKHAQDNKISISLVMGVIKRESAFEPTAESIKGALGLMQLMPATAWELYQKNGGRSDFHKVKKSLTQHPDLNIKLGVDYLAELTHHTRKIKSKSKQKDMILASYNAGYRKVKEAFGCQSGQCLAYKINRYGNGFFEESVAKLPLETKKYIVAVRRAESTFAKKLTVASSF
ncbi:MAG: transglycosylase SLT domain-containing protein [SAR324 cluster bacterium]|nr:transglycosylase SLT domain-containing protein [SAR324 cluster bacterium]